MGDTVWAFVVAGVLAVAAGLIAVRTWQVRHSMVRWMRSSGSPLAHAIPKAELRAGSIDVVAVAHYDQWSAADLARDDRAERCMACVRAVEQLERRGSCTRGRPGSGNERGGSVMHEVIVSPFLDDYVVVRPGSARAVRIGPRQYRDLLAAVSAPGAACPAWLVDAVQRQWSLDLAERPLASVVLVRERSPYGYGRASYEINLGCDYDCEHCYLGEKRFAGLDLEGKRRLLHILRDTGVLWLQITGGEPLIDPHFAEVYQLAHDLGMIVEILSNGSRLANPKTLDLLTTQRPYRISLSMYGATAETYDRLTRRRGSFRRFERGLTAALDAELPVDLSLIITSHNAHEADLMRAWAQQLELPSREYTHMSPTIYGGTGPLATQSIAHVKPRPRFTGCNAGHTFLHVDPHGSASICKVARDQQINLLAENATGLARLGGIADALMLRTGGCSGCQLAEQCSVCRPLAKLYQEAKAPLNRYCQHKERRTHT